MGARGTLQASTPGDMALVSRIAATEMYGRQRKHLGEFDPETGKQTKPAKAGRTTPK